MHQEVSFKAKLHSPTGCPVTGEFRKHSLKRASAVCLSVLHRLIASVFSWVPSDCDVCVLPSAASTSPTPAPSHPPCATVQRVREPVTAVLALSSCPTLTTVAPGQPPCTTLGFSHPFLGLALEVSHPSCHLIYLLAAPNPHPEPQCLRLKKDTDTKIGTAGLIHVLSCSVLPWPSRWEAAGEAAELAVDLVIISQTIIQSNKLNVSLISLFVPPLKISSPFGRTQRNSGEPQSKQSMGLFSNYLGAHVCACVHMRMRADSSCVHVLGPKVKEKCLPLSASPSRGLQTHHHAWLSHGYQGSTRNPHAELA